LHEGGTEEEKLKLTVVTGPIGKLTRPCKKRRGRGKFRLSMQIHSFEKGGRYYLAECNGPD